MMILVGPGLARVPSEGGGRGAGGGATGPGACGAGLRAARASEEMRERITSGLRFLTGLSVGGRSTRTVRPCTRSFAARASETGSPLVMMLRWFGFDPPRASTLRAGSKV